MTSPSALTYPSDSTSPLTAWRGKLELAYGQEDSGTQITHSYTQAPLRLQRPFYPEGPERCQSVIVHTAGGMVGGDCLDIDLRLASGAQALVTTAAAAKIYRSNGQGAQQSIKARVAAGACLEWLPQETIVFNQANYCQKMQVLLEPGAQWLGWEVTRLGRTAMGERFIAGDWRSRTTVQQIQADGSQRPIWIDRQWLPGSPKLWESPHGLNGCPVVGSLAWFGGCVDDELLTEARAAWQESVIGSAGQSIDSPDQAGVTRLPHGLLCRYRGHSSSRVNRWFRLVWQLIRRAQHRIPLSNSPQGDSTLGPPAPIPRVWQ